MNCEHNCSNCPLYTAGKSITDNPSGGRIIIAVAGSEPAANLLDFDGKDSLIINFRGYEVTLLNFTGDDYHIGRKLVASGADVVLDLVDSRALEDGLDLFSRLIDMDCQTVLAFSHYDELLASSHSIDTELLSQLSGRPVTTVCGADPSARERVLALIANTFEHPVEAKKHIHIPYGNDLDRAIEEISQKIASATSLGDRFHDRYLATRLLEDPQYISEVLQGEPFSEQITDLAERKAASLAKSYGKPVSDQIRDARYGFVHGALQETVRHSKDSSDHSLLEKADAVLTSRIFGFPIMILLLLGVFEATFALGAYPQRWIESGFEALAALVGSSMGPGWLSSLLTDGIIQGVGSVLAFLPNIIILFFFLSLLEDSGYMARAAFLMDKIMHRFGLHGRSFVPMLIGFGCNVPAIMAAKSIGNKSDRTLTMLMIPFMSCSARLPVYLLFVSAFFARYKALVMIGIYCLGIVLSILFAWIMKHTKAFSQNGIDYVSELPAFRLPTWRSTAAHVWERSSDYLKKISTVILAASVIIWALEYFPAGRTGGGADKEQSCLASIGRAAAPLTAPLGFDWKMNVCLLTGLPAKEAIVSTMGILYHTEDEESLLEAMRGEGGMTPASALAFMVFVLLYFPCIATIATLKREIGRGWAAFTVAHSLLLAWLAAFVVFRIALLL